jgi:hypothetical protein
MLVPNGTTREGKNRAQIHFQRMGKLADGASALAQIATTRENMRKTGQKWPFYARKALFERPFGKLLGATRLYS